MSHLSVKAGLVNIRIKLTTSTFPGLYANRYVRNVKKGFKIYRKQIKT
jgi:hypothetical protein